MLSSITMRNLMSVSSDKRSVLNWVSGFTAMLTPEKFAGKARLYSLTPLFMMEFISRELTMPTGKTRSA